MHSASSELGDASAGLGDDIIKEFLVECTESLDQLDRDLVALEDDPSNQPTLGSIFRTIHTIKGTCGFLGFGKLECVTHVGENLLSKLRDGELQLRPEMTTALLSLVDAVREILANIQALGDEGSGDYGDLVQSLIQLQGGALEDAFALRTSPEPETPPPGLMPIAQAPDAPLSPNEPETEPPESASITADARPGGVGDSTIRVDVRLLDRLIAGVGELVLARNQMLQLMTGAGDAAWLAAAQRLNLITSELQEGVMKTRMQPIGSLWAKLPRIVRDLALQCGKQAQLEMEGSQTDLDKSIIEAIKDPLIHLVRNAIDHGIEPPEIRLAANKPALGRLVLRAYHEGGHVNVEIADDGRGLDLNRIRHKAVERGLMTARQAAELGDRDAAMLIFMPGFSTASQVTHLSGRGVGMDVVKNKIEKIGGVVDIQSRTGQGTTITLRIPLTLAIVPALIVTCAGQRYAIAQTSLLELVRLSPDDAHRQIESLHGASVYRLRNDLLPIVSLRRELRLDGEGVPGDGPSIESRGATEASRAVHIVVLRAEDRRFGLLVDVINDTQEIVVKPLGEQLQHLRAYSGATVMGDGRVALILDVPGLALQAGVMARCDGGTLGAEIAMPGGSPSTVEQSPQATQRWLLAQVGSHRLAIPLQQVARLEEICPTTLEFAHGCEVVQYRGQVLPLVSAAELLGLKVTDRPQRPLQVVVCNDDQRQFGLVVERIDDIAEAAVQRAAASGGAPPVSAVFQGRVAEIVDLQAIGDRAGLSALFDGAMEGAIA